MEPLYTTCSRSYYFYFIPINHGHTHIMLSISKSNDCKLIQTLFIYFSLPSSFLSLGKTYYHGILQLTLSNLTFIHTLLIINSLHSRQHICFKIIKQISPSFCLKFSEGLNPFTNLQILTMVNKTSPHLVPTPFALFFPSHTGPWPSSSSSKAVTSLGLITTLYTVKCSFP